MWQKFDKKECSILTLSTCEKAIVKEKYSSKMTNLNKIKHIQILITCNCL